MTNNPLATLYRNKNIYIPLPSGGKFYSSGINLSIDGELGVMPMTIKDELTLKTPDSLFNGTALIDVIKSCVPDIANPKEIPVCDLDSIIIAIRAASEKNITINSSCPSCKHENSYTVDLLSYLSTIKSIPKDNTINLDGNIIYLKPYTIDTLFKQKIQEYKLKSLQNQLQRRIKQSENEEKLIEEIKEEMLKLYAESSEISVKIIIDSIERIFIKETNDTIENKAFIEEWAYNIDRKVYKQIVEKIQELNENNIDKLMNALCNNCGHEFKTVLELNPVNFFTIEQ